MVKKVDTWMPLMVDKYLGDTTHLTTEQHGAYLLLLMALWKRDGSLPDDDRQLAAIARMTPARWRANRATLMEFFGVDGGRITQKRLTEELRRARDNSSARAAAGAKGAESRWQTHGKCMANGMANGLQNDAPTPIPIPKDKEKPSEPSVRAQSAVAPVDVIFANGVPLLTAAGVSEKNARSMLGLMRKQHGAEAVVAALERCVAEQPIEPVAWLQAALAPRTKEATRSARQREKTAEAYRMVFGEEMPR